MLQKKKILSVVALGVILLSVLVLDQYFVLKKAHSSFDNYYAFRGCTQLLTKTPDYATCQIKSGQVIKIVKFNSAWYLDGDLPGQW